MITKKQLTSQFYSVAQGSKNRAAYFANNEQYMVKYWEDPAMTPIDRYVRGNYSNSSNNKWCG